MTICTPHSVERREIAINARQKLICPATLRRVNPTERDWKSQLLNFKWLMVLAAISLAALLWFVWRRHQPTPVFARIATLGYVQSPAEKYYEPFGVAADEDGNIYFSESITGRVFRLAAGSYENNSSLEISVVGENLETPSAIAFDPDGNLVVANTGAHTIVRINPKTKSVSVIAGQPGISGDADGNSTEARFNGPVGLAVDEDGMIFVADTYNDRIRVISPAGQVRTLAGGREPGLADGAGAEARFDTPCGIAVTDEGSLLVADTGNRRIRRVALNGQVKTLEGISKVENSDSLLLPIEIGEPMAIAIRDDRSFFIADAAGSIKMVSLEDKVVVKTELPDMHLNRPTGLAVLPDGALAFAESGSSMIRAMIPAESKLGIPFDPDAIAMSADRMRQLVAPRWPFDPPETPREIAGTFGEIRGAISTDGDAWFHNGLDIPGAYGELARAVFSEPVTQPLAVESVGTIRERVRLPLFGYIHVKIGRDKDDQLLSNFANGAVSFRRNAEGQITDVRLRRGTRFNAGDAIGALNRLNHVHLIAGQWGNEFNALSVLRLPGLTDTVAPMIEAVTIADEHGITIFDSMEKKGGKPKDSGRVSLAGKLRIFVRAYDQADGNTKHRRLGLYRIGYQVLSAAGTPLPNFDQTRRNIEFDRLPWDWSQSALVYAAGSRSGYEGATVFNYIATNTLRKGVVQEDFFDTSKLAPSDYTLRIVVADFFGNVTERDVPITVGQ